MNDHHFDKLLGDIIFNENGSRRTNLEIAYLCTLISERYVQEAAEQDGTGWGISLSVQADRFRAIASQYALLGIAEQGRKAT